MRRLFAAALLLSAGTAPVSAQLAVTSQVQVEDITRNQQAKTRLANNYNSWLMGLETRRGKEVLEVKTFVRDGVVRVEGLAPLMGMAPHVVLLSRGDGKNVWLDPVTQAYFEDFYPFPELWLNVLNASSNVKTKDDGAEKLLGRTAAITRTEIAVKELPGDPMGMSEAGLASYPTTRSNAPTSEPPYYPRNPLDQPPALVALGQEATARDFDRDGTRVRDRRIIVRTWTTTEFGDAGLLAAKTGVTALLNQTFKLTPAGLPLRQTVQATSSNGDGQRWETVVTSVGSHALPASAFEVPQSYTKVRKPVTLLFAR